MKTALLLPAALLALAACTTADVSPDRFGVSYGSGDLNGTSPFDGLDFESNMTTFRLEWDIPGVGPLDPRPVYMVRDPEDVEALELVREFIGSAQETEPPLPEHEHEPDQVEPVPVAAEPEDSEPDSGLTSAGEIAALSTLVGSAIASGWYGWRRRADIGARFSRRREDGGEA